jgi:hypothetical protein
MEYCKVIVFLMRVISLFNLGSRRLKKPAQTHAILSVLDLSKVLPMHADKSDRH